MVKVGGSLGEAQPLWDWLARYRGRFVLVHGGGPRIGAHLERLGHETRFLDGERVTPPEQLEAVEMVLSYLGKQIAHALSARGRPAIGLSGRDAGVLLAEAKPGLGRVGRAVRARAELFLKLLELELTPVVSPIAVDEAGGLNVNADLAAAAVAGALGWPVVFFTDVPGVLKDPSDPESRYPELDEKTALGLIESGVIQGGMIPKVRSALAALKAGAPWAAIAPGTAGLEAVEAGEVGTRFYPAPV